MCKYILTYAKKQPLQTVFYNKQELLCYVKTLQKNKYWFRIEKIKQ